jgi:hypothetical protein
MFEDKRISNNLARNKKKGDAEKDDRGQMVKRE